MGQDTTGTYLTTTAAAEGRMPGFQFYVDWAEYGFVADGDLDHWTDESGHVLEMRGDMQGVNWQKSLAAVGSGVVSSAYVTLGNEDFRFSPSNESSPLRYDSGSTGTNLIANSSFEGAGAGGVDVFAVWHEAAGDGAVTDELVLFYTLAHACKLTCGASNNTNVHQHETGIIPGIKYSCRLFTRVAAGDSAGRYSVYDVTNGADIIASTAAGADGSVVYTPVSFQFVAPAGCTEIALYLYPSAANGDIAYFDSVRVANVDYLGNGAIHFKRAVIRCGFYSDTNPILNPGFETAGAAPPVFASWTDTVGAGAIADGTPVYRGGAHSCMLTCGAGPTTSVHQHIAVAPGNVYSLSFYECTPFGDNPGRYSVYDDTGLADIIAVTNCAASAGPVFGLNTATFTAPAGCLSVSLFFYPSATNTDVAYFDDVSMTAWEYTRQMTGYIVAARENYQARTVELEIRDRGADLARAKLSTGPGPVPYTRVYRDHTAHDYLDHLVAQWLATTPGKDAVGACDFDLGMINLDVAWMNDETAWAEMQAVAEAQMGRLWYDKDGDLHFDDGTHWVTPGGDAWDDPTVVQATLAMKFRDCSPSYEFTNIVNHVVVDYAPYESQVEANIYTCHEVLVVPPNGSITHKAKYSDPVDAFEALAATADPATTDYWAVSAGGMDMTASISIVASDYSAWSDLAITNADLVYTAYVTILKRRGHLFLETDADSKYECEDATSIAAHGRTTLTVSSKYVQGRLHAEIVGDFLLSRFKQPVQIVSLSGVPARPWLEIGDRIHAQDTAGSEIHADYLVGRLTWQYSPKGGYTQGISLMLIADLFPQSAYFIIGTSHYGVHANQGYYFW